MCYGGGPILGSMLDYSFSSDQWRAGSLLAYKLRRSERGVAPSRPGVPGSGAGRAEAPEEMSVDNAGRAEAGKRRRNSC